MFHPRSNLLATMGAALALLLFAVVGAPQESDPDPIPTPAETPQDPEAVLTGQALRMLTESIRSKSATIDEKRQELVDAVDDRSRVELAQELRGLQEELADLRRRFSSIALGADVSVLIEGDEKEVDLGAEFQDLLEPLVQELKDATEEPRRISALRSEIELNESRARTMDRGIARLQQLRSRTTDEEVRRQLDATEAEWSDRAKEARNRAAVASTQLRQRLEDRRSIVESTQSFFYRFFQSQGFTLLLGVLALVGVLVGMRLLQRPFTRLFLRDRRGKRPFYARLLSALFVALAFVLAIFATLTVFWAAGDWVLLGLALILLFGLAWASRQTLPSYVEQIRLFLNLGAIREGERIVLDGVPYRVEAIRMFSRLVNEELSGGELRVPIGQLIGSRSRVQGDRESWFPCREGDWILLADGTLGRVLAQSPEFVQLVLLGGARQTFPTPDFLAAGPRSLAAGFRVSTVFGVDYAHQAVCTTEIPEKMRAKLTEDLAVAVGAENVVHVAVEFREAGASSLDYQVLADFTGAVAARHDFLRRRIQRSLVDACNENGWIIPFTQVTIHQRGT